MDQPTGDATLTGPAPGDLDAVHRFERPGLPIDAISLPEIEYLLAVNGIGHVTLAGCCLISLEGIRGYLRRHSRH